MNVIVDMPNEKLAKQFLAAKPADLDVKTTTKGSTVTVTTKYQDKIKDVCSAYIHMFNQDAVGLLVSEPMRFVTKVSEVY